jgi:CRISPR-associated protein Cmr2
MQVFIKAARRTRDLWFGSWLMSELSKAAARTVAELVNENALVFPAAPLIQLQSSSDLSVANKIVALVENPDDIARKAEVTLRKRLEDLAKIALDEAEGNLNTWEVAVNQIKDLPEFYWVAVPLPDENEYVSVRQKAENLLAARKNLREFNQPTWGSNRPKSSLDGNRESVILRKVSGNAQDMYKRYRAKAGEQLSGVDLLKRLGKRKKEASFESFPSTSHMASMPLRERLANGDNSAAKEAWRAYMAKLDDTLKKSEKASGDPHPVFGEADGALLFESRLRDYYGKDIPDDVGKALQQFYKKINEQPNTYYALLVGDGDFIGRTINQQATPPAHRKLSEALAAFAGEARSIVKKYDGAVVYAGGDDVMALLSIHRAIQCAAELAKQFREMMDNFTDDKDRSPTFSAGIAIFHHIEPLEDALQAARDAEKEAKSVNGKNALAVTEAKRSGAPRTVKGKWGELDTRLLHLAAFYQEERQHLPAGLAHQLRDAYLHLGGQEALEENPGLDKVLVKEAGRIVARKEGTDTAQQYVETNLVGCLSEAYTIENIANELIIAVNLARAADQANLTLSLPKESENGTMDHQAT